MKLPKHFTTITPFSKYLAMVLFVVLPFVGFLLGIRYEKLLSTSSQQNANTNLSNKQVMVTPNVVAFVSTDVFAQAYNAMASENNHFVAAPIISQTDTWWITPDNWSILVPTKESFVAKVLPTASTNPNKSEVTKLNSVVRKIMLTNGFNLNTLNSSLNESDNKFYDYVQAYEKGDTKCIVTSSPDVGYGSGETKSYSRFTVSCFNDSELQIAYDKQVPFLKGLNKRDAVVSNIKVNGDKASMSINWRRTGATAFMYKLGDEWKEIITGQAVPNCSELVKNNVPEKYWITCYNSDGTERKPNP